MNPAFLTVVACIIAITCLISGWTAAWLHWFFKGELRQALFAFAFPKSWRAGRQRDDIITMSTHDLELFIAAESNAPRFVRGVFGCPSCFSAYVSGAGTALGLLGFFYPLFLLPLAWASAAWVGHRLFNHL